MRSMTKTLGAISVLALLSATSAQATTLNITAAGGSEALLNIVRLSDNTSIALDIGEQISQIAIGDNFSLGTDVISFIQGAGGLSGIKWSLIAGAAATGNAAAQYLHSSEKTALTNIANAVRLNWFSTLSNYIGALNTSDPTAGNLDYGPFAPGASGNYLLGQGRDDWGTAGTCVGNSNICNTVAGGTDAFLYYINYQGSSSGFATTPLFAKARLDLNAGQLKIVNSVVPVPAAVWLFASAAGLLSVFRRRVS